MSKRHWLRPATGIGRSWFAPCGQDLNQGRNYTTEPERVTCGNCRRCLTAARRHRERHGLRCYYCKGRGCSACKPIADEKKSRMFSACPQ